ncbi:MAG: IS110 family transposase [Gemmobacter sp.]|nr:IS110 family transposase [Gemmobacter sp.]
MTVFAALDVSKKSTSIHIVDEKGTCLWRGKTLTDPDALASVLSPYANDLSLVGLETGCWTTWLWHELTDRGFPMVCMDARQAHAALSISINKTDANDAQGLAHLLRTGLFREVRVKGWEDMRKRALLRARATMLRCVLDLANAIRGALRTFGISLAAGTGNGGAKTFERRVVEHLASRADLNVIISPLLEAWRAGRVQVARHERAIRAVVRADPRCQLMMTVPGVGYLTAVGFVGAIGDPATFRSGRTAAAWIGLTPRRYQSGTINVQGRISRQGDKLLRSYLYEAAAHILTRARTDSALRRWGLRLRERVGFKRANVAVARKLAVVLHAMWRSGQPFEAEKNMPA